MKVDAKRLRAPIIKLDAAHERSFVLSLPKRHAPRPWLKIEQEPRKPGAKIDLSISQATRLSDHLTAMLAKVDLPSRPDAD